MKLHLMVITSLIFLASQPFIAIGQTFKAGETEAATEQKAAPARALKEVRQLARDEVPYTTTDDPDIAFDKAYQAAKAKYPNLDTDALMDIIEMSRPEVVLNDVPGLVTAIGNDCTDPLVIASLPYSDIGQTTCGRGNDYANTCLGYYDGGEDIIYQLTLTSAKTITVTLDPKTTTYTGILLDDNCPPDPATCLATHTLISAGIHGFAVALTAGTYYIMVDTWPSPNCIPEFDLLVTDNPPGRCCYGDTYAPSCVDGITEQDCLTTYGGHSWVNGATCTSLPCEPACAQDSITLVITTDNYPSETSWNIINHDNIGDTLAHHGSYSSTHTTYTHKVCIDYSTCYDVYIYDAYGDGGPDYEIYYNETLEYSGTLTGYGSSFLNIGGGCTVLVGACCYGDPLAPSCIDNVTEDDCFDNYLGYSWVYGGTCSDACPARPANDDCVNAIAITDGSYSIDNQYATDSGIGTHSINRDVFYCYTAPATGTCLIELCGSQFDTQIAAWSDCACPPAIELANDDDGCDDPNTTASKIQISVAQGQPYLIQVGSYGSYYGLINMTIATTYEYLPGDVNMAYGKWPPEVDVCDVSYLVSYFKGSELNVPCEIEGFWASADVNGNCTVNGVDVTRLVNYFRELGDIGHCPDYVPTWSTPEAVPQTMPPGWPFYCSAPPLEPPTDTVRVWYGNLDGSPITAVIGDRVDINVYIQTTPTCLIGGLETHLGTDDQYIVSFLTAEHQLHYPINQWSVIDFSNVHDSPPNPPGRRSQSFLGYANIVDPSDDPWLNSPVPTMVMTLALQTVLDPGLEGQTVPCLGIGEHPEGRGFTFTDTLGIFDYPYQVNFSQINFVTDIPGSIAGVVGSENLEPIENVTVTSLGPSSVIDHTDNLGSYSLQGLTPGIYNVMFSHPDYIDTTVTSILVESDLITPLNMTMTGRPLREPGWIYNRPRVLRDTVNAGSFCWMGAYLVDYDSAYSVTIDSIKSSDEWIIVNDLRNVAIGSLDSIFLPVTFDMTEYFNEDVYGEIAIWHSGPDSLNIIPCEIKVTAEPAVGALITAERNDYELALEPDVAGEFKIRIYNVGDLPLTVFGTSNSAPWLVPIMNTGIVTANAHLDLLFAINTAGIENTILTDILMIQSNAANEPSLPINITATVAPDSVAGASPLGDVNYDGWCNEADVEYLIHYLFYGGPAPCMPAGDINGDENLDITDAIYLIDYLRFGGEPPVYACSQADNYRRHDQSIQAQLGQNITGHRGDWIDVPVMVQHHDHYKAQIAFDLAMGVVDNVSVEDVTGIGFETYATIETNTTLDLNTITIADSVGSSDPVAFDSLTQIYNLRIHIGDDAPLGAHAIGPAAPTNDRGPTMFLQPDNFTSLAPMFYGSTIAIRPRVTLDGIIGVPDIAYLSAMRSFPLSLKITSDADVANIMNIFIMELSSGDTIHTDNVSQFLTTGTHTYDFNVDWQVNMPGFYTIGAGIVSDLDEAAGNYLTKNIYITDEIQTGLPPVEGFGETRLHSIRHLDNSLITDDLPSNYVEKNEDEEIPEWEIYDGMSHDPDNTKCVHMPGYNYLGPHDDWLVYGPLTGVSLEMPVVRFWETAFNWNDTSGSTHEFYIQYASDFDISTAETDGPILTHTPENHGIAPLVWLSVSVLLPDSIGVDDKVYFAWRYVGPEDQAKRKFDIWRVDYIEWYDSASRAYEYYPGDANMYNGGWQPAVIGSDVTYLVNYFRIMPTNPACLIDGFYCSADVNGDCNVIGSDVTRLVSYFRSIAIIEYCPDYEPAWHVPADFPSSAPSNWPNCGNSAIFNSGKISEENTQGKVVPEMQNKDRNSRNK